MIVGPIFEALAEKLRVSREKFSYILDCTTTPICALIPFIGWGVYTMGLIESELNAAEITYTSSMEVFVQGIPLNFYAILTLAMAGLMAITQWDFGPCSKHRIGLCLPVRQSVTAVSPCVRSMKPTFFQKITNPN